MAVPVGAGGGLGSRLGGGLLGGGAARPAAVRSGVARGRSLKFVEGIVEAGVAGGAAVTTVAETTGSTGCGVVVAGDGAEGTEGARSRVRETGGRLGAALPSTTRTIAPRARSDAIAATRKRLLPERRTPAAIWRLAVEEGIVESEPS